MFIPLFFFPCIYWLSFGCREFQLDVCPHFGVVCGLTLPTAHTFSAKKVYIEMFVSGQWGCARLRIFSIWLARHSLCQRLSSWWLPFRSRVPPGVNSNCLLRRPQLEHGYFLLLLVPSGVLTFMNPLSMLPFVIYWLFISAGNRKGSITKKFYVIYWLGDLCSTGTASVVCPRTTTSHLSFGCQ